MATQPKTLVTLEAYLACERVAEFKSEFYAGQVCAMAGGTETHASLSFRVAFLLALQLQGRCRVYGSDLKVYVEKSDKCVYPDAMVLCGTPQFLDQRQDVVLNPTLIVEVLSPSTEAYDRSDKLRDYRRIPSMQHCLLIAQDNISVEHFARQEGGSWMVTQYPDQGSVMPIPELHIEISIYELYQLILDERTPEADIAL